MAVARWTSSSRGLSGSVVLGACALQAQDIVVDQRDAFLMLEVAAQLGAARPTLNRALSSFQRRGWIEVQRGGVEVLDVAALARFADS